MMIQTMLRLMRLNNLCVSFFSLGSYRGGDRLMIRLPSTTGQPR